MSMAMKERPSSPSRPSSPIVAQSNTRVLALHRIVSDETLSPALEKLLTASGIAPDPELVEAVLRLSYSSPLAALRFFRWAGCSIKHTANSWNFLIDILGKNALFDSLWDAMRSMHHELGALSTATFASIFSSYCSCGQFKEAIMSFEVMERYGVVPDIVALNALISAFCRQYCRTADAVKYLERIKGRIAPDGETFTILLEGWQKEGNVVSAMKTFGEMVLHVGWTTKNVPAYNALLRTLICAGRDEEAMKFLKLMKSKNCSPGLEFFNVALEILVKKRDFTKASELWNIMVMAPSPVPDLQMYYSMVFLCCENNNIDFAYKLLDEMPFNGVFPDSAIYGVILDCLVSTNNAPEAEKFFAEMRKNEKVPSARICAAAIRMFFNQFNPMAAQEVWRCVVEERISPAEDCAREVIRGFLELSRLNNLKCCMEEILDIGIELPMDITDRVKSALLEKTSKDDSKYQRAKRLKPMR